MAEEAELDEKPQPKVHHADVEGDVKSLDRFGERNLYLIVKQQCLDVSYRLCRGQTGTNRYPYTRYVFHLVKGAWELTSIFRHTRLRFGDCLTVVEVVWMYSWLIGNPSVSMWTGLRVCRRYDDQKSVATWLFIPVPQIFFNKGHTLAGQCQLVVAAGIQDFHGLRRKFSLASTTSTGKASKTCFRTIITLVSHSNNLAESHRSQLRGFDCPEANLLDHTSSSEHAENYWAVIVRPKSCEGIFIFSPMYPVMPGPML